jgi:predicted glycoside hydrolase/deacetylase ChbG (UPF0249 family)
MKRLIVNADDFGLSISVNDGIVRAHTDGIVTSTSLMVRQPAAEAAAAAARTLPGLSVGLHVDIAEWERHGDAWRTLYEWAAADDPEAVRTEVQAQLERFERLLGRMPTHLDSHQHLHRSEPLRSTLLAIASTQSIPVRHYSPARYCGAFYAQGRSGDAHLGAISPDALAGTIQSLMDPLTELCCHPAAGPVPMSTYDAERLVELQSLCHPAVRKVATAGEVVLVGFGDQRRARAVA